MAGITTDVLKESIRGILKDADLSALSAKKVRGILEEKFEEDFTARKQEIDKILMQLITEQHKKSEVDGDEEEEEEEEEEEDEEGEEIEPRKRTVKIKSYATNNGTSDQSDFSQSESDDEEYKPKCNPPPKKKTRTQASAPKNKRASPRVQSRRSFDILDEQQLNDEELAKKLQDEENNLRVRPRSAKKPPPQPKKEKKKRKGRTSIYSKPCLLSGDLADVMGTDRMARKDIVKRMWEIVKERKLEDPRNKQFMLCDEQLKKVFGRKRVRTFGMMKLLKTHIRDME